MARSGAARTGPPPREASLLSSRRNPLRRKVILQVIALPAMLLAGAFGIGLTYVIQDLYDAQLSGQWQWLTNIFIAGQGLIAGLMAWLLAWAVPGSWRRAHVAVLVLALLCSPVWVVATIWGKAAEEHRREAPGRAAAAVATARRNAAVTWSNSLASGGSAVWDPLHPVVGEVRWLEGSYPTTRISGGIWPVFETQRGLFVLSGGRNALGVLDRAGRYTRIIEGNGLAVALSPDGRRYALTSLDSPPSATTDAVVATSAPDTLTTFRVEIREASDDTVIDVVEGSMPGVPPLTSGAGWADETLLIRAGPTTELGVPITQWSASAPRRFLVLPLPRPGAPSYAVLPAPTGQVALVSACTAPANQYGSYFLPGLGLDVGGFAVSCRGDALVAPLKQPDQNLQRAGDVMGMSPDGRYLVLAGLRVLDVESGAVTQLPPAPSDAATPGWGTGFWHDLRRVDVVQGPLVMAVCEVPAGPCTRPPQPGPNGSP